MKTRRDGVLLLVLLPSMLGGLLLSGALSVGIAVLRVATDRWGT